LEEIPPNYFTIEPLAGKLPRNSSIETTVNFVPLTLCRAQIKLQLIISQYGFKPVEFNYYGVGSLIIEPSQKKGPKMLKTIPNIPTSQPQSRGEGKSNPPSATILINDDTTEDFNIYVINILDLDRDFSKNRFKKKVCRAI
jgi:hypothetical protein